MRDLHAGVPKRHWGAIHIYEYVPDPAQPYLAMQLPNVELRAPAHEAEDGIIEQQVLSMLVDDGPVPQDDVSSENSSSVGDLNAIWGDDDENGAVDSSSDSDDEPYDEWAAQNLHHAPPVAMGYDLEEGFRQEHFD